MFTYIHYTIVTHVKNYNCSTFDSRKQFSKQCNTTATQAQCTAYNGGWVGALSAHLGDCTLLPSWPPWITHGTNQCIFLIWELQLIGAVQHRPLKPFWLENMHSFYGPL